MGRTKSKPPLSPPPAELGRIVFYCPERRGENTVATIPAIIHFITEKNRGIVDLTLFTPDGPKVIQDIAFSYESGIRGWWSANS